VELDLDVLGKRSHDRKEGNIMLSWPLTFLILVLIATVLGVTGVAGTASQIAWIVFAVCLVGSAISLISGHHRSVVSHEH